MRYLSFLLFPFALLYGAIVRLRHWCYNTGIFKEHTFAVPTICVGNVAVGGTGKSPMVEYLVRQLHPKCRVAVLSRGYKRKTKGFVLADTQATVADLGDEPFQFWRKFHKDIILAVCGDRVEGLRQLLQLPTPPTVVILDDAFQHRPVKATKNVVLTAYGQLFTDDWLLPVGRLRDVVSRVQQADIVVVTKCPPDLSAVERERIVAQLQKKTRPQTPIVFATIAYSEQVYSVAGESPLEVFIQQPFTLVTGIANPQPLLDFLKKKGADFQHIAFPDHHHFTDKELQQRWEGLHYLPIEMQFCTNEDVVKFGTVFGAFMQE